MTEMNRKPIKSIQIPFVHQLYPNNKIEYGVIEFVDLEFILTHH